MGPGPADDLRVVVVDDDPEYRALLGQQLGRAGGLAVVGTAADGIEALQVVRDLAPDAVAMDLLMPRMNGFEAIEALRREHPDVGVVAFTAVAGPYACEETERLGVELVVKSRDPSELADALTRSVGRAGRVG